MNDRNVRCRRKWHHEQAVKSGRENHFRGLEMTAVHAVCIFVKPPVVIVL